MKTDDQVKTIFDRPNHERVIVSSVIDWQASFKAFCESHGLLPVSYRGRLLFPDGWTHSASDYKGPRWPAPTDAKDLLFLQRAYWSLRRQAIKRSTEEAAERLAGLEQLQRDSDVALVQTIRYYDAEAKRWVKTSGPIDFESHRGRLEWLKADLIVCEQRLAEIRAAISAQTGNSVA